MVYSIIKFSNKAKIEQVKKTYKVQKSNLKIYPMKYIVCT